MAAVTAALMAAAAASASIYGGIQGQKEGEKQAERATAQASAAAAETRRLTERQTTLEQRDIKSTEDKQRLAYLASGVTLEGSPLLVMEETRRLGAENIDEIQKAGGARASAQVAEGRNTAETAKAQGRQAMIQGAVGAAGSLSKLGK